MNRMLMCSGRSEELTGVRQERTRITQGAVYAELEVRSHYEANPLLHYLTFPDLCGAAMMTLRHSLLAQPMLKSSS